MCLYRVLTENNMCMSHCPAIFVLLLQLAPGVTPVGKRADFKCCGMHKLTHALKPTQCYKGMS